MWWETMVTIACVVFWIHRRMRMKIIRVRECKECPCCIPASRPDERDSWCSYTQKYITCNGIPEWCQLEDDTTRSITQI